MFYQEDLRSGVVNYLTWCMDAYGLAEGRGAPVHSPTAFDLTLSAGGAYLKNDRRATRRGSAATATGTCAG